ncbi:MAG: TolC family protein [Candidatus Kapabacteria bacterium]|nr:TolC family protein [Candidatus Kapabacteria bacterium]
MRIFLCFVAFLCVSVIQLHSQRVYTFDEYYNQIVTSNPLVLEAKYEITAAEAELFGARGLFDPVLSGGFNLKTQDAKDKLNDLDLSLEIPFASMFGPKVKAQMRRAIAESTNPADRTSTPFDASIGVSLPLGQGIFTDEKRNKLFQAEIKPEIGQAKFQQKRNKILVEALSLYWKWAEAYQQVQIAQNLFTIAQERAQQLRDRATAGDIAAMDSLEANLEVVFRNGKLLEKQQAYEQASVNLQVYVWDNNQQQTPLPGIPEPFQTINKLSEQEIQAAQNDAKLLRPEVKLLQLDRNLANLDLNLANEFLRPNINANVDLMMYGLSDVGPGNLKFGLTMSQPILFRQARSQEELANIGIKRIDLQSLQLDAAVTADVNFYATAVNRTFDQIQLLISEVSLASQLLNFERERLIAGETSLFLVNQRERFLATSQEKLAKEQSNYFVALIYLRWARGII